MTGIGSVRVLESTKEDNIFMYFAGEGSDNIIMFPSKYLYANELQEALKYMHENYLYHHHLAYYLEAGRSGSMFGNLPKDMNIYANTAANPYQASYAYYCDDEAKINGTLIKSC